MEPLTQLIDRIAEVCPMPAAVQRVIALTGNDDADVKQVIEAVMLDPALASEVLRLANSAAFGHSHKMTDLAQAVMMIGLSELHRMAAAMALLAAFRSKEELSLQLHDYAVLSATISRSVAREISGVDARAAFLCGLLCEIGAMACLAVDAASYAQLWRESIGGWDGRSLDGWGDRMKREVDRYGATTPSIGGQLLRRNLLPDAIAEGVEGSLVLPEESPAERVLQEEPGSSSSHDSWSPHDRPYVDIARPARRRAPRIAEITAFARSASLVVVQAGRSANPALLDVAIPGIAGAAGLTGLAPDLLVKKCLDASQKAAGWIRAARG